MISKDEALAKGDCKTCCAFRKGECGAITSYGKDICPRDFEKNREGYDHT